MSSKLLFIAISLLPCAAATRYYVDSVSGSDSNRGNSRSKPWKSLDRVNNAEFRPGDAILFKAGSIWTGQLWPKGSGAAGSPISIDSYGGETRPVINGSGAVEDVVRLHNQQHWEIRNLEITNRGEAPKVRRGVHVVNEDAGTLTHIVLSGLVVHDVNGDNARKDNGGIIWRTQGRRTPSRFVDLRIENCRVYKVDRSGIVAQSSHYRRTEWFPSLRVVIRNNVLDDIGGDGITPWACDGALVEYNVVSNCNRRAGSYNAGIWPWSCDNTVLQYNEAYLTRTTKDGQGFDSDYNSRNTLFQYNYSHDNEGGFMLICNDGGGRPEHTVGNTGTTVRYNISQNDGARVFHISGPVKGAKIYNNTVYAGKGSDVQMVMFSNWGGWADDTLFQNNILYGDGTMRYGHEAARGPDGTYRIDPGFEPAHRTVFDSNVYFGRHVDLPDDAHAITADPRMAAPGTGRTGRNSVNGYKLLPDSPCIDSGVPVQDGGGRDYWGNPVPQGGAPDRGAHESKPGRRR